MSITSTTQEPSGIASPRDASTDRPSSVGLTAAWALLRRELIRFIRQPARVAATIGTPAIMWVVLASGFGSSFRLEGNEFVGGGVGYGAYLVAGMCAMAAVFTSIFASMSLIEDRNEGFLQGVLVSPAPTWSLVLAKVVGSALIASVQAGVLLLGAPLAGAPFDPISLLAALAGVACMSLGITGIGLALAWKVNSTAGFHGIMNLVLMPMLLLSGAFFPLKGSSVIMAWLMRINPLTWPSEVIRGCVLRGVGTVTLTEWSLAIAFAALGAGMAWIVIGRGRGS